MREKTTAALGLFGSIALALAHADTAAATSLFAPSPADTETYAESYTVVFDLDATSFLLVQLAIHNAGLGDANSACRLLYVDESGASFTATEPGKRADWRHDAESDRLFVGPCTLGGTGELQLSASVGGARVFATVGQAPREHRTPGDQASGELDYRLRVLVPWGRARLELALPGVPTRTVRAMAYADHFRGTTLPSKLARRWFRLRLLRPSASVVALIHEPPGAKPRGWWWSEGEHAPRELTRIVLPSRTAKPELELEIDGRSLRVAEPRLLYHYAPLDEHGFLGFVARAVVGNPNTRTYRARLLEGTSVIDAHALVEVQDLDP